MPKTPVCSSVKPSRPQRKRIVPVAPEPKAAPIPVAPCIEVRGARQNNLKGIDIDLPLGKLIVITGPSGSGKSSLAFDTLYAEGQRRYVETFSPYTRQFLDRMDKPLVDEIRGIPPSIAIEQSNPVRSTRSTVGTITEINDYLKLLMPRVAHAFCPVCSREILPDSPKSIVSRMMAAHHAEPLLLVFSIPAPKATKPADFFDFLRQQGYLRVLIGGQILRTDEPPRIERLPAEVDVIQDRFLVNEENRGRITESVEIALRFGKGRLAFVNPDGTSSQPFSTGWHCAHCNIDIRPPGSGLFSFNHPVGACPACRGFGRIIAIDHDLALPDRSMSIKQGVVKPFQTGQSVECQKDLLRCAAAREVDVTTPFCDLPQADQDWVIQGESGDVTGEELWENGRWYGVRGFFQWMETKSYKMHVRVFLSKYRAYKLCHVCHGGRYQPDTLNFKVPAGDGAWLLLPEINSLPAGRLADLIGHLPPLVNDPAGEMLRNEILARLRYLCAVGLSYLSLDRPTRTLSGGEIERVNLTTCLGASLVNTLFVLDEPSIGLHPRDTGRLIRIMESLRDKGNTLLVVEHEESVMRAADELIDIGPGRGEEGGHLVFQGSVPDLLRNKTKGSLTADYLSGRKRIGVPERRREPMGWITVRNARQHNLKGIDVRIPLGVITCFTGVSGSGKSTLVHEVLYENLLRLRNEAGEEEAGLCDGIDGAEQIREVVMVDQRSLVRTPRSCAVVYLGVFDHIREQFAMTGEALSRGLTAGTFSFNSGTGRCARCGGLGFEKIEMQFLSDLYVRCVECEGKRYQPHVLQVRLQGKTISEVLEMTVTEAIEFFGEADKKVSGPLQTLASTGLGYLRLGQPLNTLSGGESQRLKLVGHLAGKSRAQPGTLFMFDEPTTGLHFDDVAMLVEVFDRLVEQGHSLLVVEHNLEVIKRADHLIDLGPEAGAEGGEIVAEGTPEVVSKVPGSHTGRYLQAALSGYDRLESNESDELLLAAEAAPRWRAGKNEIIVRGAREHNLKNIDVTIPRDSMVVVTGLSGSGKSTLAFDILFAEGQRRFLDSMSPYARQFVTQLEKPDVDWIDGLPPAVAIEQRLTVGGGKSTVSTVTEVYQFLRLLFAKLGVQHCPDCHCAVEKQSVAAIVAHVEKAVRKGSAKLMAPLIKARKGFHTEVARWAVNHGFEELFVDGQFVQAEGFQKLERFKEHTIDVVIGTLDRKTVSVSRELVEKALSVGKGTARLVDSAKRVTVLSTEMSCPDCGRAFEELDPRLFSFNSPHGWCPECRGFGWLWNHWKDDDKEDGRSVVERELHEERASAWVEESEMRECPSCLGARINEVARSVQLQGGAIQEFSGLPVGLALQRLLKLKFAGQQKVLSKDIIAEIRQRLEFMLQVGLGYLSLDRSARTLSGGESQRIRLAAQLGSNLRGVLYVLDEPTIGLHPRDNDRLLDTLEALKKRGNSLVIVEHDDETMRRSDHILDLGPAAGAQGGRIVAEGTLDEILENPDSVTGRCLREPIRHPMNGQRRSLDDGGKWIRISGARANNLKKVDVKIPLGRLTVLSGISGSGKSTLMREVLLEAARDDIGKRQRGRKKGPEIEHPWDLVEGMEGVEAVYEVDQSPIGKTSRSTPATYVKVFDEIRKQFAQIPLSRMRGYTASRFSFNTEGGRCEACAGQGVIKMEMNFLPASYVPCEDCGQKRYNLQTLEVEFNGKSIGDIMQMTIAEAAAFFAAQPRIYRPMKLLEETGLGYLKLGQASPTLSGGEAQRLKLVTELTRGLGRTAGTRNKGVTTAGMLYLLEEPTIGLHLADVEQLLRVMHRLVDEGHTVVVIEHHPSVMAEADYLIDIGPEAGSDGGEIVAEGTPEFVAKSKTSRTAPFLKAVLGQKALKITKA